ncbi:hypothetical protein IQ62_22250 [Streptomyces scabiei]|nr:hypothetical protein IQ62_22250 [Streptomyces scabiei]
MRPQPSAWAICQRSRALVRLEGEGWALQWRWSELTGRFDDEREAESEDLGGECGHGRPSGVCSAGLGDRYRCGDQCRQECGEGELVEGVEFDRPDLGVDGAVEAAQREFRGKG